MTMTGMTEMATNVKRKKQTNFMTNSFSVTSEASLNPFGFSFWCSGNYQRWTIKLKTRLKGVLLIWWLSFFTFVALAVSDISLFVVRETFEWALKIVNYFRFFEFFARKQRAMINLCFLFCKMCRLTYFSSILFEELVSGSDYKGSAFRRVFGAVYVVLCWKGKSIINFLIIIAVWTI